MFKKSLFLLIFLFLAFSVWAAQNFFLADIVIEGNKRVQAVDILNAINIKPGQTGTPAEIDAAMAETVLGKIGKTEDVAHLCAFLASDLAGHITGQVITVDGGQYI